MFTKNKRFKCSSQGKSGESPGICGTRPVHGRTNFYLNQKGGNNGGGITCTSCSHDLFSEFLPAIPKTFFPKEVTPLILFPIVKTPLPRGVFLFWSFLFTFPATYLNVRLGPVPQFLDFPSN